MAVVVAGAAVVGGVVAVAGNVGELGDRAIVHQELLVRSSSTFEHLINADKINRNV